VVNSTSMLAEIQRLRAMTVAQLQLCWRELYGEECRSRNKDFLFRRLAWRTQELARGGLSAAAHARLAALAPDGFTRARTPTAPTVAPVAAVETEPTRHARDPRLPAPGTVLSRQYHGREIRVVTLDDGFEWEGRRFGSLSEVARAVTGQHWSGPLFFGLRDRKRKS